MKKLMKTLSLIMAAALTFGLAACEKDPENTEPNEEITEIDQTLLLGAWDLSTMYSAMSLSGTGSEMDGTEYDTITLQPGEATLTFNADNTLTINSFDEETGEPTEQTTPFTISGNTINISASSLPGLADNPMLANQTLAMVVTELTETSLNMNASIKMGYAGVNVSMDLEMFLNRRASK